MAAEVFFSSAKMAAEEKNTFLPLEQNLKPVRDQHIL